MIIKSGSWAEVNLNNIGYNLKEIKNSLTDKMKICCVVKANAYGCGSVKVSEYLENKNIDFFAVSRIEEGLELRNNDIKLPILCLGYIDINMIKEAIEKDISITVYNLEYVKKIDAIGKKSNKKARVHIKIDTGMSRLGFLAKEATKYIKEINNLKNIYIEGIFTHFAKADEKDKTTTLVQLNRYKKVIEELTNLNINIPIKHVANSAAIIDLNEDLFNMVRIGIILYGYYPSGEVNKDIELKPCLKLKSVVTNVKVLDENVGISYGHIYKTSEKSKIVTISIGYADGFNRIQHNPKVSIKGEILEVVGRVCMDQCMVKVPLDMDIKIGDEVTIIDNDIRELSVEENAKRNDTINYEILCMINRRVTRVYKENEKIYSVNYLLQ
ncbi:alanine racemase [Terrisporobacter petrolearius]|uniref:alanine racemase n=1 Tax=Terrisporobacter petrolearius TaxID=1460447 RepID=UPI001D16A904|nr:alanine racemase [Terrisporobacter petrolearius]MCC3864935.1 alanine racemase [Terrisporobacter petrolearius]